MHGDVCLQNVSALHLSSAHGVQRVSDPPPAMWVLGIKLGSTGRAASALN